MFGKVVVVRDFHWQSNLIHNMDLRDATLVIYQEGSILVNNMELS